MTAAPRYLRKRIRPAKPYCRLDRADTPLYDGAFAVCIRIYPDYFDVIDHRNIMAAIVRAVRKSIRNSKGEPCPHSTQRQ
jgi:hypothetical protein